MGWPNPGMGGLACLIGWFGSLPVPATRTRYPLPPVFLLVFVAISKGNKTTTLLKIGRLSALKLLYGRLMKRQFLTLKSSHSIPKRSTYPYPQKDRNPYTDVWWRSRGMFFLANPPKR
jgi:hypothetical protein